MEVYQSKNIPPHLGVGRIVLEPEHEHLLLSPPAAQCSVYSVARWQCAAPSDLQCTHTLRVNKHHQTATPKENQINNYDIFTADEEVILNDEQEMTSAIWIQFVKQKVKQTNSAAYTLYNCCHLKMKRFPVHSG